MKMRRQAQPFSDGPRDTYWIEQGIRYAEKHFAFDVRY